MKMWRMTGGTRGDGSYEYQAMLEHLLRLIPGKFEKYMEDKSGKKPDTPDKPRIPRSYGEIKSQKDLEEKCFGRRACAIALLPAITTIDYEMKGQAEREIILADLDKAADKSLSPLHYSWVNTTCHNYIFNYFGIDPLTAPNVVFYNPAKGKHASMIGTFDKNTVLDHQDRFVKGKLATADTPTKKGDMKITDVDCAA